MKTIREQFEEIWPVPEGVYWHETVGDYMQLDGIDHWEDMHLQRSRDSYAARLNTFTRCQEKTAIHLSLIEELVADVRYRAYHDADDDDDEKSKALLHRINQIMEQKK